MNYFRFYVGDYLKDTSKLSLLEHGAYSQLLAYYYAEESPLPLDKSEIFTMVRAMTSADRKAVDKVLGTYFKPEPNGYHNARADHEISVSKKARDNGAMGGRPQTGSETETLTGTQTGTKTGTVTGMGGGSGHPPTTNHQPLTTNTNHQRSKPLASAAARRPPKVNSHRIVFNPQSKRFEGISEDDELRWQEAYQAVPIPPEIAKAAAWIAENPANRKSNYGRFLVNWFTRAQDRAVRVQHGSRR